ncbi:hypothetical protein [Bradyrhizobium sp.]|jgi:phage terminase small subunit|uniref:hypothetical protein n=1 Tax=Bradyrhizobium sp. TaxID=376 RepID=UPI002DDDAD9E|nr:hypothetical protein [Bradyrhizobium sp.]HEV2155423.1 hypothetical protein [Bradyrhizobium sp.]
MERAFAAKMAVSGDPAYSAEKAGYAHAPAAASKLMRNPDVAEEVRRRARLRLQTEGAEVGVRVLIELAEDVKQKGSTRGAAAKALVQLSGITGAANLSEADLAEMPPDKIRELLSQAQRQLEARMKVVSGKELPIEGESAQDAPNPDSEESVFA